MQFKPLLALVAALAAAMAWSAGCQRYERRPLDPGAHHAAWQARRPGDDDVVAFARRLSTQAAPDRRFDPGDGITRAEAEIVALVYNPDLRIARARARVTAVEAEHGGRWEDPELEVDVLRIGESVPDRWIVGTGLALTIPLSGRLAAERDRAEAAVRAELDRIAAAEWSTRRDLRRDWTGWSATRLRLEETAGLVTRLESLVGSIGRLAELGEMRPTEAALFTIELAQRRQEIRRLRAEEARLELMIRVRLGLAPSAPVEMIPTLAPPAGADAALAGDEGFEGNLTLSTRRADYEVAEQTLRREIRKQFPDLTIGPQYESDEGQSRIGFVAGIPLPLLNANRVGIAAATAEREVARAIFETEMERIAGRLEIERRRLRSLREQRAEMEATLVPLVDRQLADARELLELGEGGGLVLLESLVRAHGAKLQLIRVRADEAIAAAEIAHLRGPATNRVGPAADATGDPGEEVNP